MSSPGGNKSVETLKPKIGVPSLRKMRKDETSALAKPPSFWTNARKYFAEYTKATSLNGFQYLGEPNRSKFERIMWLVIIGASLGMCGVLILDTYKKWESTPVIVTFAHSPMPVWKVPFPAITICPETKWLRSVYNFTKYYELYETNKSNLTRSELKRLGDASLLCQVYIEGNRTTDEDVFHFMNEDDVLLSCTSWTFGNQCETKFSTVMTEEGICYSFNILDRNDTYRSEVHHSMDFQKHQESVANWSIEEGYAKFATKNAYPRRTMSAGDESGLKILLMAFPEDLDYLCRKPTQGFKVYLHNPGEMPQMSRQYFRVPFDEDVTVAVKPDVMTTSSSLRNYDPHKRGCYFANEKQLSHYKNYTQQNCLMECLTNHTLDTCGCVMFYMPRRNTTKICGPGSMLCVNEAKHGVLIGGVTGEFDEDLENVDCDCLPSCTTITYNTEISQTSYDWWKFMALVRPEVASTELVEAKISSVSIFFKEMQFATSERNELYGVTDFLANCGGLLGLFVGFSLISLMETLYFLTVRLGINLWKYGRHYWSGSEDLLRNKVDDK